jgi:hypothetical protein
MKQRNPLAVFFLPMVTFGIYSFVWEVKTKNEMNKLGSDIPTAWLLIVPLVNYYWLWKYSLGVEKTTNGNTSAVMAFVLLFVLGAIGMAIIQNEYNKLGDNQSLASAPGAWTPPTNDGTVGSPFAGQAQPDNSFGGPIAPTLPVAAAAPVMPVAFAATPSPVIPPEQPSSTSAPVVVSPTSDQAEVNSQPVVISPTNPDQPTVIQPQTPPQA